MPHYIVSTITVVEAASQPEAVQIMSSCVPFDPRFVDGPYCDAVEDPARGSTLRQRKLSVVR